MNAPSRIDGGMIGRSVPRIDGRLKVTGAACYPSDVGVEDAAHAFLVTSTIARGRIKQFHLEDAQAVEGVLDILTYENTRGKVGKARFFAGGGYTSTTIMPMDSPKIWHDGQIVAMVVAETFEAAREAAHKVRVDYDVREAVAGFGDTRPQPRQMSNPLSGSDPKTGDAEKAFREAEVQVDAYYATPTQHHNPIELFTTTCVWSGDTLTVYEPSQFVHGLKNGLAQQLNMSADKIRVVSPFVGGAFGSKAALTPRTAFVALAAKRLNRPVKLVSTRAQAFTVSTYRAETEHHVKLGADRSGRLTSLSHEGWEVSSRPDNYKVAGTETTSLLYACPNIYTKVNIVHADRGTPGFMRSPAEVPYVYALECAMDELAVALTMDPVELRRINDTQVNPIDGKPYSSRALMQCYDRAAEAFGWSKRNPLPGSMTDGDWLIGWGCATACYPSNVAPAEARVTVAPNGTVRVQTAGHDIGTGAYTAIALTAADLLGVPLEQVSVELGDSTLPPAPVAGGSNATASICNAVAQACEDIRDRLAQAASHADGPLGGADHGAMRLRDGRLVTPDGRSEPLKDALTRIDFGPMESYVKYTPEIASGTVKVMGHKMLESGLPAMTSGSAAGDHIQYAFGAEFLEVRIHRRTREIRVPRIVGAFAAGRIISPTTARSQLLGGMIWGIGSALHEATDIDRRAARYLNDDLAEYLIPVNADIRDVDVIFVPEEDYQVNALGIKGLGELGNVGTAAAVSNAVFHATGRRIRDLPIRIEDLL
ncbi:xanthine dehydrogenase family protein molybdopterin-binding subunit [Microvirga pudoricolor]|uniref:xanthine dehydrogenase family protein molybdopterin-binding subunit n=1 Tax=Microvirga pudoricolor TaxID=2778729 RepID=UPI00194F4472|nr:xanthine dehydrogenase family protein molybdopterin-binding subunit [Microvirga pudoricolor]MBM6593289.1 xanthine dehydrogenase family protein molybdopterin-binding subunit [Microvirga pudoricolor]